MSLFSSAGQLAKMYMVAYKTNEQNAQKVTVDGDNKFVFQVNPETYKRKFGVQYSNEGRKPGTGSDAGTLDHIIPETFTVDILFDNSGVIQDESLISIAIVNPFASGDDSKDVTSRIENLKKFCYDYQSDIHRPYYVRLCWGDESGFFFGVVTTLEIDYKLFQPDGKPIRAVAHLSLNQAEDPTRTQQGNANQSPDITHEVTFAAGMVFSDLAYNIYGSSDYYIDVAKANGLLSFRNIKVGTVLQFPPLK